MTKPLRRSREALEFTTLRPKAHGAKRDALPQSEMRMTPYHFVVVTSMGNGHVYPVLPLCRELKDRRHRVTYITNEMFAQTVSAAGAEAVIFKTKKMSKEEAETIRSGFLVPPEHPKAQTAFKLHRSYRFAETLDMLTQVQDFYARNQPDVVLYDRYSLGGRILGARFQVATCIQLSGHFAYYNSLAVRENGVCCNPPYILDYASDWDSFLWKNGIVTKNNYWHVEDLNIHFIPKQFQHHSESFDDRFCFTGALLNRAYQPAWTNKTSVPPTILISGMSGWRGIDLDYSSYYRKFIEALSGSYYRCILSIDSTMELGHLPGNFEISNRASHLEILPYSSLHICHGGMASTLEATYHGVPALMMPMSVSCREVAYRAEELGLGMALAYNETSPVEIKSAVKKLIEDRKIREHIDATRATFRASGGEKVAAQRIEHHLSSQ